ARSNAPHSAPTQLFITTADNGSINYKSASACGYGYCVFGMVTEGMDVVDAIENLETASRLGYDDVPRDPVVIRGVRRL
ncbi:MAG: peptidylprolyl isomerase, partial [Deltaproteobacteria bacterium]|nr:peptidylprolyl isomerase [Deltaproteobacteria bacterium]